MPMITPFEDITRKDVEPKKLSHVLLEKIVAQNELMIKQMMENNKNLTIVGAALLKIAEKPKKAVDKK